MEIYRPALFAVLQIMIRAGFTDAALDEECRQLLTLSDDLREGNEAVDKVLMIALQVGGGCCMQGGGGLHAAGGGGGVQERYEQGGVWVCGWGAGCRGRGCKQEKWGRGK